MNTTYLVTVQADAKGAATRDMATVYGTAALVMEDNGNHMRSPYEGGDSASWQALLLRNGVADDVAAGGYNFDYRSAMEAFARFQNDTPDQKAYWTWWLKNQNLLKAGANAEGKLPSLVPPPSHLPRLKAEYDYHVLAQAFYALQRQYGAKKTQPPMTAEQLEAGFRKIGYNKGHPRQQDALRTLVRVISDKQGVSLAWAEVDKIQDNAATRDVYPYVEDLRFILMTDDWGGRGLQYTPELREAMLRWLIKVVQNEDRIDVRLPFAEREAFRQQRRGDALHHLNLYLTTISPLDWWLQTKSEAPKDSPRLTALSHIIGSNNMLAWMQTDQTTRMSPMDYLYAKDSAQWKETSHLAHFAYENYKAGKGREWLLEAIELARPDQKEFNAIVADAAAALEDGLYSVTSPQLQARLWQAVVWAKVASGKLDEALAVLPMKDIRNLGDNGTHRYFSYDFLRQTQQGLIDWYIHQGDFASARKVMTIYAPKGYTLPNPRKMWDSRNFNEAGQQDGIASLVILAQTPEELNMALAQVPNLEDDRITPVLNLMPREALYKLATAYGDAMPPANRIYLLRLVATRAWLLGDTNLLQRAALVLNKILPAGDKPLLEALDSDETERLRYILKSPRMKPMAPAVNDGWGDGVTGDDAIDPYNHNDNNWWCSYKPDANKDALERAWARMPDGNTHWNRPEPKPLPPEFAEARAKALAQHPITKLADATEQEKIAAIPQAPQFLTEKVLKLNRTNGFWFWKSEDKRIPEMLHFAVRTTRYGCNRDGSHQSYSFDAYRALQKSYSTGIWAKATPYWFK